MKPKKLKFVKGVAKTPIGDYEIISPKWYFGIKMGDYLVLFNKNDIFDYIETETKAIQKAQSHFDKLVLSCLEVNE